VTWLEEKVKEMMKPGSFFLIKNPKADRSIHETELHREKAGLMLKDLKKILKKRQKKEYKKARKNMKVDEIILQEPREEVDEIIPQESEKNMEVDEIIPQEPILHEQVHISYHKYNLRPRNNQ